MSTTTTATGSSVAVGSPDRRWTQYARVLVRRAAAAAAQGEGGESLTTPRTNNINDTMSLVESARVTENISDDTLATQLSAVSPEVVPLTTDEAAYVMNSTTYAPPGRASRGPAPAAASPSECTLGPEIANALSDKPLAVRELAEQLVSSSPESALLTEDARRDAVRQVTMQLQNEIQGNATPLLADGAMAVVLAVMMGLLIGRRGDYHTFRETQMGYTGGRGFLAKLFVPQSVAYPMTIFAVLMACIVVLHVTVAQRVQSTPTLYISAGMLMATSVFYYLGMTSTATSRNMFWLMGMITAAVGTVFQAATYFTLPVLNQGSVLKNTGACRVEQQTIRTRYSSSPPGGGQKVATGAGGLASITALLGLIGWAYILGTSIYLYATSR